MHSQEEMETKLALGKCNWSNKIMSKQFDVIEKEFQDIVECPSLFTDKCFVMNAFSAVEDSIEELEQLR